MYSENCMYELYRENSMQELHCDNCMYELYRAELHGWSLHHHSKTTDTGTVPVTEIFDYLQPDWCAKF